MASRDIHSIQSDDGNENVWHHRAYCKWATNHGLVGTAGLQDMMLYSFDTTIKEEKYSQNIFHGARNVFYGATKSIPKNIYKTSEVWPAYMYCGEQNQRYISSHKNGFELKMIPNASTTQENNSSKNLLLNSKGGDNRYATDTYSSHHTTRHHTQKRAKNVTTAFERVY